MSVTHEPSDLTPQQYRCVERVALGMTDKEIGLELGITGDTVREHVGAARKTLGGRSRAHTVVLWLAREAA
jgi:DNA-binding CsgD family transcriptional regulator